MNEEPGLIVNPVADAEHDLARLQRKIETARAVLLQLLQEVVVAETAVQHGQAAKMLEANEELVVAGLRSQADAATAMIALDEATRAAELDALTQLPNRALLVDRLNRAMVAAGRHGGRLALLFVDIDGFKQINDTLGHALGDEVLRQVASCLAATMRAADTVCRWGGDEFVVLLTEVSQSADAGLIAGKIALALAALPQPGAMRQPLTASIGISIYPDDGSDAGDLIAHADTAMYLAKRHSPASHAFHETVPVGRMTDVVPSRFHLTRDAPLASRLHSAAIAGQETHHSRLREVNEQLVLAVISAQELRDAAEQALQRQTDSMAAPPW